MKKKFYIILFSLFAISLITGCGGFPKYDATREKKLSKTLEITDIKREGLTIIEKTMQAAPAIEYKNEKKPRRVNFGSSANATAGILYPNFPVTINFKNTKVSHGLVALGNMGGRNIIISDNVQGLLNMEINNEPWNEVFNSIIELKKLSYTGGPKNGIIKIYTVAESGEIYSSTGTGGFSGTEIFNIYYEKPSEIKAQISLLFEAGGEGSEALIMTENDVNQTLIVKGTYKQIDEIEKILDELDQKKPQILIEAFILEVSPTFEQKLGARLGLSRTKEKGAGSGEVDVFISGTAADVVTKAGDLEIGTGDNAAKSAISNFLIAGTSGIGIIRKTSGEQLKFEIDALEREGDSRTLSNPKLFTVSGKNAVIEQGTQFAVTQTITNEGVSSSSVTYLSANLILDVTANITGDGNITLALVITNDSPEVGANPRITAKKISTNVILADGDIAVIGGVLTESLSNIKKGIPGLSKIPLLGALFRSRQQTDTYTELLIFVAPRII